MRKLLAVLFLVAVILSGCTESQRARVFGGEMTIELEEGQKLVNVTWKETDLWYLTRDRLEGEAVESYSFIEESTYGVLEGTVTFKEN